MRYLVPIFFLFVSFPDVFPQKIEFFSEDLNFKLQHGLFEVDGLYYFKNLTKGELRQMLFYPFPDVEKYGQIAYIEITKENDTVSQLVTQSDKGALFKVIIPPFAKVAYKIRYGQNLKTNEAKYIITTTQNWGKPFEQADYSLEFPVSLLITDISIEPDTIITEKGNTTYLWQRQQFMPDRDFVFVFESR